MFYCAVLSAQLCPTLCYSMDCSPPGSSVEFYGQWSLAAYSPWGRKDWDMSE